MWIAVSVHMHLCASLDKKRVFGDVSVSVSGCANGSVVCVGERFP